MKRALTRSRKNDFWELTATTKFLPRETRDYVPMILAAVIIAKNPAQYGFDIVPIDAAAAPKPSIVPPALDLRRVAEWAGVPMDDIQALNPEFRRWTTPVKKGEYTIKVPAGHGREGARRAAAAAPGQLNAMQLHTVKRGETLATIAKKLQVSRADLAEANYLKATSRVAAGARLIIPRMPSAALLARASAGELEKAAETIVADVLTRRPTDQSRGHASRGADLPGAARRHASAIARKTGTTIAQLKNWNKLRTTNLKVGTRLLIQSPRAQHPVTNSRSDKNKSRAPSAWLVFRSDPCFTRRDLAAAAAGAQRLDALLDALGHFALALQRAQRVLRFLHHEVEPRELLADVIDHRALLAEHLEVDVDVVEQVGDRVGARLHLFDHLAARLDRRRSSCRCR